MKSKIFSQSIRMPKELSDKIKFLASLENRSTNNWMVTTLQRFVVEYEAQNGPIPVKEE